MLTVGIHRHHDAGAGVHQEGIAGPQRGPAATILRQARHDGAGAERPAPRIVLGAVVDDEHRRGHAVYLGRHARQELREALGLVVRGDRDRDTALEPLRQVADGQLAAGVAEQGSLGSRRERRGVRKGTHGQ